MVLYMNIYMNAFLPRTYFQFLIYESEKDWERKKRERQILEYVILQFHSLCNSLSLFQFLYVYFYTIFSLLALIFFFIFVKTSSLIDLDFEHTEELYPKW